MLSRTASARSPMIMGERPLAIRKATLAHHALIVMRLSTLVTPGARQAARSASCRSAHDRTLPLRITSLPIGFDGDALGIDLGVAAKGFLDLALDLGGHDAGLEDDQVADPLDASDAPHCVLGAGALVVPLGVPFERDPAVLDDHLHVFGGVRELALSAATASRAISGSGRSAAAGRRTSMSLATPTTPETRFTSASACHFWV